MKRKSKFLIQAISVGILLSCTGSDEIDQVQEVDYVDSIVRVKASICDSNTFSTSLGLAVNSNSIITVAHSLEGAHMPELTKSNGELLDAKLVALNPEKDLALFRTEPSLVKPFKMAKTKYGEQPGDEDQETLLLKFEAGALSLTSTEIVSQNKVSIDNKPALEVFKIDTRVDQGDSGAALLNNSGELLGMVFATGNEETNSWALSHNEIELFIDSNPDSQTPLAFTC